MGDTQLDDTSPVN